MDPSALRPSLPDAPTGPLSARAEALPLHHRPGEFIGAYKLLDVIGEGGFGVVYLAERRAPMVQRVALKVLKPGMDSRAVVARFEQERQALAVMDHPNVAKVFDGGVTERGLPYFVMEFVHGMPITQFADRQRLTIRQRLELFLGACEAVQHAHHKGIIHRDLKPSNILVATPEGHPVVKVIDFGVAKAISNNLSDKTIFTEGGQLIGTPEYMSPEQAEMGRLDIDTRADVYSLGVVLYELLTGTLPFDSAELRAGGFAEIQRIIRDKEPQKPSTRMTGMDRVSASNVAMLRQTPPQRIATELKRELEWIPLKAMRKERERRYAGPEALAADVLRYLRGEPLEAAPESRLYLARKLVARNRAPFLAGAAAALALLLGLGAAVVQRNHAVRMRQAAEQTARDEAAARKRAETIRTFVIAALASADPHQGGAQSRTILDAIRPVAGDISSGRFSEDPETDAAMHDAVGAILLNNGRAADAEPLLARALELRRNASKAPAPDLITSLHNLAYAREALGHPADAVALHEEALALRRSRPDADEAGIAASLMSLASAQRLLGRLQQAEASYLDAMQLLGRAHAGDHSDVATCLDSLGAVRLSLGKAQDAAQLFSKALDMRRRVYKGDHPNITASLSNLAQATQLLGNPADAEPLFEQALAMSERVFAGDHPDVAALLSNLATIRRELGRPDHAEALADRALSMYKRLFNADHPDVAVAMHSIAHIKESLGRPQDAEPLYAQALAIWERLAPGDHPQFASTLNNLAYVLQLLGRAPEAEPLFVRALDMRRRVYKSDHAEIASTLNNLAAARQAIGKLPDAENLYADAIRMQERLFKGDHPELAASLNNLASVVHALDRPKDAEPIYARALQMHERLFPGDHPSVAVGLSNLARARHALGMKTDARELFDRAVSMQRRLTPGGSAQLARLLWRSGAARLENADLRGAETDLNEAVSLAEQFLPPEHPFLKDYRAALERCAPRKAESPAQAP